MSGRHGHWKFSRGERVNGPVRKMQYRELNHHIPGNGRGKTNATESEVAEIRRRRIAGEKPRNVYPDYPHLSEYTLRNIWYGITMAHITGLEEES